MTYWKQKKEQKSKQSVSKSQDKETNAEVYKDFNSVNELKAKATKEEKKSLERIETIAILLPLLVMAFITAE